MRYMFVSTLLAFVEKKNGICLHQKRLKPNLKKNKDVKEPEEWRTCVSKRFNIGCNMTYIRDNI